jgi:hypothetical protein
MKKIFNYIDSSIRKPMKLIHYIISTIQSFFKKKRPPFLINYTLISSTDTVEEFNRRTHKFCYYCGTSDTSLFKNEPHLTPDLLTKNRNTYNYECDICNDFFSMEYETHLTHFTRPFVVLAQCKTKKGYPKIKMPNGDFIQFENGQLRIHDNNNSFPITYNEEKKMATLEIPRPKFIPYKIYKSLIKIGISLLPPEKIDNYSETIKWLRNPELDKLNNPMFLAKAITRKLNNQKYSEPIASLYEAKEMLIGNTEYFQHILVVSFANFEIQIYLPPSKEFDKIHNPKNQLGFELFPIVASHLNSLPTSDLKIETYDLSIKTPVKLSEYFHMHYKTANRQY